LSGIALLFGGGELTDSYFAFGEFFLADTLRGFDLGTAFGQPTREPDGRLRARLTHVFEVDAGAPGAQPNGGCDEGENCFATESEAVLTPTDTLGVYSIAYDFAILAATGEFTALEREQPVSVTGRMFVPPLETPGDCGCGVEGRIVLSGELCFTP
jgi:hypothetical protein